MGDLTANFSTSEFLKYDAGRLTFATAAIPDWTSKAIQLRLLCQTILQPMRDGFGRMEIMSGYRSPEWNKVVGGSPTSDHLWTSGCCADVKPHEHSREALIDWLMDMLPFAWGEAIYYADTSHMHVGLPTAKDHGQLLFMHRPKKVTVEIPWRGSPKDASAKLRALIAQHPK